MTPKQLLTSVDQDWQTPPDLFAWVDDIIGFTVDAAASFQNALCQKFWTEKDSGLNQDWESEIVWCNPPYGRNQIAWVRKAHESKCPLAVLLLPARTDTLMWHTEIFPKAQAIIFLKGRLKFNRPGSKNTPSTFPSALVVFANMQSPFFWQMECLWTFESLMLEAKNFEHFVIRAAGSTP